MDRRGISPVLGTCLLVVLTVLLVASMGTVMLGSDIRSEPTTLRVSASADATADRITLTHEGGDAIDPKTLELRVTIDGTALEYQPPVPFFAAKGFRSGPTGPFNAATGSEWTAGETGSIQLASTNAPALRADDRVEITLLEGKDGLVTVETTAE
ncbi:type IV pilin N-terminal domain-containing protein [Halorhabdus rudnickae]|uniref:type IV pilin N-terminal domain-containing protein n=1 Tax=Halorhabdus rudnickae TaxID=1775544 RepID=UPI001082CC24|nr:type IV pilin N-terminal domain-containing protein [Halorhabdus rudnickae]